MKAIRVRDGFLVRGEAFSCFVPDDPDQGVLGPLSLGLPDGRNACDFILEREFSTDELRALIPLIAAVVSPPRISP